MSLARLNGLDTENVNPVALLTAARAATDLRVDLVPSLAADLAAPDSGAPGEDPIAKGMGVDRHVAAVGWIESDVRAIKREVEAVLPGITVAASVGFETERLGAIPFGTGAAGWRDVPRCLAMDGKAPVISDATAQIRCMADGGGPLAPNAPVIAEQRHTRAFKAEWSLLPIRTWWYGPLGMLRRQADAAARDGDDLRARELRTEFWDVYRIAAQRREVFRRIEEQRKNWRRAGRGRR